MSNAAAYLHGNVTSQINACAIAVHKKPGPGFLESIYEEALCVEFDRRKITYQRQLPVRVRYEGIPVGLYRLDLVVDRKVVVEVKAVDTIHEAHLAVALAYLKATGLQVGVVINFADSLMRSRRVFREAHGVKEPLNLRTKEKSFMAASPPKDSQDLVSLWANDAHKDKAHGGEDSLPDPQLVGVQPERTEARIGAKILNRMTHLGMPKSYKI
jgi:GxxExxY protein